jgi:hypothetical protein
MPEKITTQPDEITVILIEGLLMPNGEIIVSGKTVGWYDKLGKYVYKSPQQ